MPQQTRRIHIRKEAYKFAAAHMTVLPDGSKEALHGHNYTTELSVDCVVAENLARTQAEDFIPFKIFKKGLKQICDEWDEKVLLPAECRHLKFLSQGKKELEFLKFLEVEMLSIMKAAQLIAIYPFMFSCQAEKIIGQCIDC